MNGFGTYASDGFVEDRGGLRTHGGAAGDMMERRRRQQQQRQRSNENGLGFGATEGSAFDRGYDHHPRGGGGGGDMDSFEFGAGGGGYDPRGGIDPYEDDRYEDRSGSTNHDPYGVDRDRNQGRGYAGNFDHRSRLGFAPVVEERGPPHRFDDGGGGYGSTTTRGRSQGPSPYEDDDPPSSWRSREFGGAGAMMQERHARQQQQQQQRQGGSLHGGGGIGGGGVDRRPEPLSFGNYNFHQDDPLDRDKPALGMGGGGLGGGGTKPGVQFCTSHDAVSAKIVAFDGKGVPMAAHQHPQIEIAPGIMARLRGAKETWECGTCKNPT